MTKDELQSELTKIAEAVRTKKNSTEKIPFLSIAEEINNLAVGGNDYPIGYVYMSYEPTSPAELFGGDWVEITGVFPYFNSSTETGGSNTHTLTVAEMPSHNHAIRLANNSSSNYEWHPRNINQAWGYEGTSYTGGSQPHNNMPAYQSFYAWRKVA